MKSLKRPARMFNRSSLLRIAALTAILIHGFNIQCQAQQKKNVLFIAVDDLRLNAIRFYNPRSLSTLV